MRELPSEIPICLSRIQWWLIHRDIHIFHQHCRAFSRYDSTLLASCRSWLSALHTNSYSFVPRPGLTVTVIDHDTSSANPSRLVVMWSYYEALLSGHACSAGHELLPRNMTLQAQPINPSRTIFIARKHQLVRKQQKYPCFTRAAAPSEQERAVSFVLNRKTTRLSALRVILENLPGHIRTARKIPWDRGSLIVALIQGDHHGMRDRDLYACTMAVTDVSRQISCSRHNTKHFQSS